MNESSREKLDMDLDEIRCNNRQTHYARNANSNSNAKSNSNEIASQLTFERHRGVYVRLWIIIVFVVSALLAMLAIGLLVAYLKPCPRKLPANSDHDSSSTCTNCKVKLFSRLPTNVVPVEYKIQLQPYIHPAYFYFDGNVSIKVECRQATDSITLHVNDIIIHNDTIDVYRIQNASSPFDSDANSDDRIDYKSISHDFERQFFVINLRRQLKPNNVYIVTMSFKGNLNNELVGFYRSTYEDATDGRQRWMAVTQFQATDARRAFPCFDEPAMKAKFSITLIHYSNMTALSNMPAVSSVDRGEWTIDEFATTVNMSTYLLAFVVGDIASMKSTSNDFTFAVWSRKSVIKTAEYALQVGPKMLKHYENFFNISFPLPKMDMVAVPDFNAGAMENWGLITYRETAMLYENKVSSSFNLQNVATVIAHELAHQWFGNLVTPKWWDDLWLNEGFASYMEYEGVDGVHPNWKMYDQFVVDETQSVFELDCLNSSHPISVKVGHPDEINEIFDRISYGKGAAIIKMMNHILGSDTFKKGVSNYLNALRFQNAEQDDLWFHLTAAQDESIEKVNVKKVMDSWTLQTGYPVVTLTRNYETNTATLRQKRFLLITNNDTKNMDVSQKWEIPITYTNEDEVNWNPKTRIWMRQDPNENEVEIPQKDLPSIDKWMIVNLQEVGFYRVNYDAINWNLLITQLIKNHTKIHATNRAQILDDLLDLARAGQMNYPTALTATTYLRKEEEYVPWEAASSSFAYLGKMLRRTAVFGEWKRYILKLITPLYESIGWSIISNEDILKQGLQFTIISWACNYELPDCVNNSRSLFNQWKENASQNISNTIPPTLRSVVYCTSIKFGDESDWNFVWGEYVKNKVAAEGDKLMQALACSRQPWILNRYLDWAFNESSRIRKQDGSSVFRAVATNNYGRDLAFNYLRDKWEAIVDYYGKSFFSFGTLVRSVSSSLNTKFELAQLTEFYNEKQNNLGSAERSFKQSVENTKANVEWMQTNYADIQRWILKESKQSKTR